MLLVKTLRRPLAGLICTGLVLGPVPARAEETIRCESHGFRYNYCRVDTDNRVSLVRKHGFMDCREGSSWGYDRRGVWVDRGCSGEFRVGSSKSHDHKAAVGVAAVAGIALLAALASNHKSKPADEVPGWAVGSFSGFDPLEGAQVQVTILPGGSVEGRAADHSFTGSFAATRLEVGKYRFQVTRSGNGFEAVDEDNAGHKVLFKRTGSGY
jgi:hypothetical protein